MCLPEEGRIHKDLVWRLLFNFKNGALLLIAQHFIVQINIRHHIYILTRIVRQEAFHQLFPNGVSPPLPASQLLPFTLRLLPFTPQRMANCELRKANCELRTANSPIPHIQHRSRGISQDHTGDGSIGEKQIQTG